MGPTSPAWVEDFTGSITIELGGETIASTTAPGGVGDESRRRTTFPARRSSRRSATRDR